MKCKTIFSIDPSTSITGWALWENNKLKSYGNIKPKDKDYFERIYDMVFKLSLELKDNIVDKVILEEPSFVRINPQSSLKIRELYGIIKYICKENGIQYELVNPKTWKSKLLKEKKRTGQKKEAIELVNKLFKKKVTTDDEADAILIGYYILNKDTIAK